MSTITDGIAIRMDLDESTYLLEDFKMPEVEETLDEQAELERERIDEQIFESLMAF